MQEGDKKNNDCSHLVQGNGNAIDTIQQHIDSRDMSMNTHNIDSHNSTSNHYNSDSHNVTNVYVGRSPEDISLGERKDLYRKICQEIIKNGIIDRNTRYQLDNQIRQLHLDEESAHTIENEIKRLSTDSNSLSITDETNLELLLTQIKNDSRQISDNLSKMEVVADKVDNDEVQFFYHLALMVADPSAYVRRYNNRKFDSYWLTYWAYMAFKRLGRREAENILSKLSNWNDAPADNATLIQVAGLLYDYHVSKSGGSANKSLAINKINKTNLYISNLLSTFRNLLLYIAERPTYDIPQTEIKEINFYLRMFEVKEQKPVAPQRIQPIQPQQRPQPQRMNTAAPVYQRTQPRTVNPVPTSTASNSENNPIKKWGIIGVAAIAVLLVGKNFIGNSDKNKEEVQTTPVAAVSESDNKETEEKSTTTSKTSQSKYTSSNYTRSERKSSKSISTSSQKSSSRSVSSTPSRNESSKSNYYQSYQSTTAGSSNHAQPTVSKPEPTQPVQSRPEPKVQATMSASELVSKGKSALRRFQDAKALQYFSQAAQMGSGQAYFYMGEIYNNGGNEISRNYPKAFTCYRNGASAGDPNAQYMLGMMYRTGHGCDKDFNQARKWLNKAASQGHGRAAQVLKTL